MYMSGPIQPPFSMECKVYGSLLQSSALLGSSFQEAEMNTNLSCLSHTTLKKILVKRL